VRVLNEVRDEVMRSVSSVYACYCV